MKKKSLIKQRYQTDLQGQKMEEKTLLLNDELKPTELEIETAKLLSFGFWKRGFSVKHNGNMKKKSPGGKTDIEVFNNNYHLNVEVTKTTKSQADREFNSVKAHLQEAYKKNSNKKCFCLYISPETFKRNMDSFALFNKEENLRIFPMDFITFNYFITYLIENDERYFNEKDLERLFDFTVKTTTTDVDILGYINSSIIKDPSIEKEIKELRDKRQYEKNREIEAIMKKIHNMLRRKYGQNPDEAVKEVSKIIFIKMFEEDKELREKEHENRCTIKRLEQFRKQGEKDPINYLFGKVREEMKEKEPTAMIFDDNESVELDPKTVNKVLELINGYNFVQLGLDIKGKIYELFLGSTMKNTALGQYFTPEEIINFMIDTANLRIKDKILDPLCGTGRFLTKSMDLLVKRAEKSGEFDEKDIDRIKKKQFYGIELSKSVSKIAKMNMYIHGDGKSNIYRDNMITFNHNHKEQFNVILTNPPFGDIDVTEDVEEFEDYEQQIIKEFPCLDIVTKEIKENGNGTETHIKSKGYKGGSLLLQKALIFLNENGKLLTVMDDGVLNTDNYKDIRSSIKKNYFIKAIISLPHTTFKRLAKSSPKASILYLTKKDNPLNSQKEPIFFAHAELTGIDTRGRKCRNDFDEIKKQLTRFLDDVKDNISTHNGLFNRKVFSAINKPLYKDQKEENDIFKLLPWIYTRYIDEIDDRLDFNYNHPKYEKSLYELQEKSKHPVVELIDIIQLDETGEPLITSGQTPDNILYLERGDGIPFLGATNIKNNSVNFEDCSDIEERIHNTTLQRSKLSGGELLITMAGTIGACSVYPKSVGESNINQAIAKIILDEKRADARYVSMFLNSYYGQLQFSQNRHDVGTPNINLEEIKKIVSIQVFKLILL